MAQNCIHVPPDITGFACSKQWLMLKLDSRQFINESHNWLGDMNNSLILLLYLSISIPGFADPWFLSASLSPHINMNTFFFIFSLNNSHALLTLLLIFLITFHLLNTSHFSSYLIPISSCLPSLRELSNNRSLDNLDSIGGSGSSLPRWDDDDFSQVCSTLGRRSCLGQVSVHLERNQQGL